MQIAPEIRTLLQAGFSFPDTDKGLASLLKLGDELEGLVLAKTGDVDIIAVGEKLIRAKSAANLEEGSRIRFKVLNTETPAQVRLLQVLEPAPSKEPARQILNFLSTRATLERIEPDFIQSLRSIIANPSSLNLSQTDFESLNELVTVLQTLSENEQPTPEKQYITASLTQQDTEKASSTIAVIVKKLVDVLEKTTENLQQQVVASSTNHADDNKTVQKQIYLLEQQPSRHIDGNITKTQLEAEIISLDKAINLLKNSVENLKQGNYSDNISNISQKFVTDNKEIVKYVKEAITILKASEQVQQFDDTSNIVNVNLADITTEDSRANLSLRNPLVKQHIINVLQNVATNLENMPNDIARIADNSKHLIEQEVRLQAQLNNKVELIESITKSISRLEEIVKDTSSIKQNLLPETLNVKDVAQGVKQLIEPVKHQFKDVETYYPQVKKEVAEQNEQIMHNANKPNQFTDLMQQTEGEQPKNIIAQTLSNISQHITTLQQHQVDIRAQDVAFWIFPLWFQQENGVGDWSTWEEEANPEQGKAPSRTMLFELKMSTLGQVKILLKQADHDLAMKICVEKQSIQIAKDNIMELKERLSKIGFNLNVTDILSPEQADIAEFAPPGFKVPFERSSGFLSIIA